MAIRSSNKVLPSFNMASMTDLIFLLLIFFMVTSTLATPNALNLLLPQSDNQAAGKPITRVGIQDNGGGIYTFFVETTPVAFSDLAEELQKKLFEVQEPTIALHADRTVPIDEVVKVMNIARNNRYKVILATSPENRRR